MSCAMGLLCLLLNEGGNYVNFQQQNNAQYPSGEVCTSSFKIHIGLEGTGQAYHLAPACQGIALARVYRCLGVPVQVDVNKLKKTACLISQAAAAQKT